MTRCSKIVFIQYQNTEAHELEHFKNSWVLSIKKRLLCPLFQKHKVLEYQLDAETYQASILQLKQQVSSLNHHVEKPDNEKNKLSEELDAPKDMVMINLKSKKQEERDNKEVKMREYRSLQGLLGQTKAWSIIFQFLTIKEYVQVGKLSKKMYQIMIENPAGRTTLHYIQIKYVNQ